MEFNTESVPLPRNEKRWRIVLVLSIVITVLEIMVACHTPFPAVGSISTLAVLKWIGSLPLLVASCFIIREWGNTEPPHESQVELSLLCIALTANSIVTALGFPMAFKGLALWTNVIAWFVVIFVSLISSLETRNEKSLS